MAISFEDFVAQLTKPGGLEQLRAMLRTSAESETLRRGAAVASFDKHFYENVIAKSLQAASIDVPEFSDVLTWSDVERIDGERVAIRGRNDILRAWSDPAAVTQFRLEVVHYCEQNGSPWRDELLRQLFTLGDSRAARVFSDSYKEADDRFDLARCQQLLELAFERYGTIDSATRSIIDSNRALLRARSFWKDDYYKSLVYLPRPGVDGYLQSLLSGNGAWIGNLFAEGGRGKTAAIRYLIARTCVQQRIPVGRIDFGFTNPSSRPTALLLIFVQQFEEQVPGTIFNELRRELTEFESTTSAPLSYNDSHVRIFMNRFATTIREVRGPEPSLLILDNMEDAILGRSDVLGMLDLFAAAQIEAPALRLLLSGRISVFEPGRVDGIERFRGVAEDHEVDAFDDAEARTYLIERRGVTETPAIGRVIESAEGMPFKLSLYADIIRDDPSVSIDELVAEGSVELTYLILRIVRRLDVRLQWVLRYGVVPSKLTRAFFNEVMAGYLPPALSGASKIDDPTKGLKKPLQEKVFRQGVLPPHEQLQLDVLWTNLCRYAAEHSWVAADKTQPDTLVFHDVVRRPMRKLLRQNDEIFRELHRSAAEHFDGQGNARESVYHRFQIADPNAEAYWRRAVEKTTNAERREAVRDLARVLLTEDFLDGDHPVRDSHGDELVRRELLIEASIIEAMASIGIGRLKGPLEVAWRDASAAAARARRLRAGLPASVQLGLIDAAVFLNSGDVSATAAILEHLSGRAEQPLAFELLRGQVLAALSTASASETIEAMRKAKRLAVKNGFFGEFPSRHLLDWPQRLIEPVIVQTLVDQYAIAGNYEAAFKELQEAIARARDKQRNEDFACELTLRLAELQLDLRLPSAAIETLDTISLEQYRVRAQILRARASLLRFAPLAALDICDAATQAVNRLSLTSDFGLLAGIAEMRAQIHAAMMEIGEARIQFDIGLANWREAAQRELKHRNQPATCLMTWAAIELREFQDQSRAESLHSQAEKIIEPGDRANRFALAALRSRGDRIAVTAPPATSRQSVELAILRANSIELARVLGTISPPHARVTALAPLRHHESYLSFSRADAKTVMAKLPDPRGRGEDWTAVDKDDRAGLAIEMSEISRILNRDSDAHALLEWGYKRLENFERPLLDRVRLEAENRLGIVHRSRRSSASRWTKLLAENHSDFLAVLLFAEARSQRGKQSSTESYTRAFAAIRSSEVRTWLQRQGGGDEAASAPSDRDRGMDLVHIAIAEGPSGPEVTTTLPSGDQLQFTPKDHFLFRGIYYRGNETVSYDAVKMLAGDAHQFAEMMFRTLADERLRALIESQPVDLALEISSPVLQAYPWELALRPRESRLFRSIYRVMPSTEPRWGQIRIPRTPMRVLVVRRSERSALLSDRGFTDSPAEESYRAATRGLVGDLRVLEDPRPQEFLDLVENFDPDLIHISGSVGESPSLGGAYLEFSTHEISGDIAQSLSPRIFQSAVRHERRPPIIVIEATSPRGYTEAIRQIMLRNVFAAELFGFGTFGAVIATGEIAPSGDDVWGDFVHGLSDGVPLGQLMLRMRDSEDLGRAATTFFSRFAAMTP